MQQYQVVQFIVHNVLGLYTRMNSVMELLMMVEICTLKIQQTVLFLMETANIIHKQSEMVVMFTTLKPE
jgi:hypothetical protein